MTVLAASDGICADSGTIVPIGDSVASAIVGASRPEQVTANAAASGIALDEATVAEIDRALSS